jgi:AraC family transcriptional regulator of adaptative response/methylated-DNA-[protein]-cysteine methyltransferase
VRQLEGREPTAELPLDVRATSFQRQVWEELRNIPWGQTRTYGEVARAVGQPTAARAVARACATNPAALVIPCHRVVPAGGGTGGYRWGAARKARLLKAEAACSPKS